jgi:hypothetical protein
MNASFWRPTARFRHLRVAKMTRTWIWRMSRGVRRTTYDISFFLQLLSFLHPREGREVIQSIRIRRTELNHCQERRMCFTSIQQTDRLGPHPHGVKKCKILQFNTRNAMGLQIPILSSSFLLLLKRKTERKWRIIQRKIFSFPPLILLFLSWTLVLYPHSTSRASILAKIRNGN